MSDQTGGQQDDLEAMAAAVDQAATPALSNDAGNGERSGQADAEGPQATADQTEAIAASITMAVGMLSPLFPSLKQVYTEDAIGKLASTSNALAQKHGFVLSEFFTKWKEEIAFGAVGIPIAMATYQAVLHDLEERERQAQEKQESTSSGEKQEAHIDG